MQMSVGREDKTFHPWTQLKKKKNAGGMAQGKLVTSYQIV